MQILLDTHVFIWFVVSDPRLSAKNRKMISEANKVFVSSASIWEINIKIKLNKFESGIKPDINKLVAAISDSGFLELPITVQHAASIASLSDVHKDPFDRILIAQAMCEPLTFITADRLLERCSDLIKVI